MKTSEIKILTIVVVFLLAMIVDSDFLGINKSMILLGIVDLVVMISWLYVLLRSVKKTTIVFKSIDTKIGVSRKAM